MVFTDFAKLLAMACTSLTSSTTMQQDDNATTVGSAETSMPKREEARISSGVVSRRDSVEGPLIAEDENACPCRHDGHVRKGEQHTPPTAFF